MNTHDLKIHNKKAFTLVEAMVLMLALTIIIAATTPIITKKHTAVPRKVPHGKYVCYKDTSDVVHEVIYKNSTLISNNVVAGDHCTFNPPQKAPYFLVQAVGGGGGGGHPGALTNKTLYPSTGNISIFDPVNTSPNWMTQAIYENTGYNGTNFTITIPAVHGGKGGDFRYWSGSGNIVQYGGAGGSNPVAIATNYPILWTSYSYYSSTNPANGVDGIDDNANTSGIGADTHGTPCRLGSYTLTYNSTTSSPAQTGTCNGGRRGSEATGGDGSTATSDYNTSGSPGPDVPIQFSRTTIPWEQDYYTQTWKYGEGGSQGSYAVKFLGSLKNEGIPIYPGSGGAAGTAGTSYKGQAGSTTYFGSLGSPILTASGATSGGDGNKTTSAYELKSTVLDASGLFTFVTSYGYVKYGTDGSTSAVSDYIEIAEGQEATADSLNSTYGRGGDGGGTYASCWASSYTNKFNGYTVSTVADPCSSYTGISYYPYTKTSEDISSAHAQHGYGGAVMIIW